MRSKTFERFSPRLRLGVFAALTALLWLFVLPMLSRLPGNQRYLKQLDDAGIDPSAMYYTELPPELFADRLTQ